MSDDRLDLGVSQVVRVLDRQLASVDSIQTKIGVLLGFASASLALLFSLGLTWVTGHVAIAALSAVALLASIAIFAASLMLTEYEQAPDPSWLVDLLNKASIKGDGKKEYDEIREQVIGAAWKAYDNNQVRIKDRFALINWAVALLVIGLGIFVIGVLVT